MKLKNTDLDFYEVTRLKKEICLDVVKKLDSDIPNIPKFKLDELSYMYFMAQHNYFTEEQLKKLVMYFSQKEVGKKL